MPLPTTINDLSKTAGSNFPQGTDSPSGLDDTQRAHASFIAQVRDGDHVAAATAKTTLVDADFFPMNDSAASNILKKITWANIKAALAGLYQPVGSYAASGANIDITSLGGLTTPLSAAQGGTGSTGGAVLLTGAQTIAGVKTFSNQPVFPQAAILGSGAVATTSGTTVVLSTSIPAGVSEFTVHLDGVSTNGSSVTLIQAGTSGGYVVSGYNQNMTYQTGGSGGQSSVSTGIAYGSAGGAAAIYGNVTFRRMGNGLNKWSVSGVTAYPVVGFSNMIGGVVDLGAEVTSVRLNTVGGTDTHDAGNAYVTWKGPQA